MDYSNILHLYYSSQQARVFNNVFLYSKKKVAKLGGQIFLKETKSWGFSLGPYRINSDI